MGQTNTGPSQARIRLGRRGAGPQHRAAKNADPEIPDSKAIRDASSNASTL